MLRRSCGLMLASLVLAAAPPCFAQAPAQGGTAPAAAPNEAGLLKSTEVFVRKLFAWGPDFQLKLGPLSPSSSPEFYRVPILVTFNGQSDTGEVFVSKDGKTLLRGEMFDTGADPFAATRAKLKLDGDPAKGPADAPVTIVEFSDFQCPHCRVLYNTMQTVEQHYPHIRVVYKDFPLVAIHPWAMMASVGARCAFVQKPEAFWMVRDLIFENQDLISSENIYQKLLDFAQRADLDKDAFKVCMTAQETKPSIDADLEEGKDVQITSTPTVFVNGRPVIGGDQATLEQYIQFELGPQAKKPAPPPVTPAVKPKNGPVHKPN